MVRTIFSPKAKRKVIKKLASSELKIKKYVYVGTLTKKRTRGGLERRFCLLYTRDSIALREH